MAGLAAYTLLLVIALGALAISIWAIADAASKSSEAFRAAGSSRKKWMMVLVFFTIALDVIGVVLAIVYLALVRPRVRAVQHP
ncbi:MAG TPA: DUF2516 family protein [Acidimicrobiales bacterium]|nr:DUF2516 family protein [Acidimicrobiales bacterium]